MPTGTLKDIVKLSTGFKTAVNVQDDLDNLEKAAGYLPTEVGHRVIFDVTTGLHPAANQRARLIMGTYGTGKSHLALVLANLYRRRQYDARMQPLMERLASQWGGQTEKLKAELDRLGNGLLVVLLEGNEGEFNDALLRALKTALSLDKRTADLLPETVFTAAVRRVQQLEQDYPDAYEALDRELAERGLTGAKAVKQRLDDFDHGAYEVFREAHRAACAGADFVPEQMMNPGEAYALVARQLVREGLADGLVVVWDEFGRYMEAIADDPRGGESRDIGRFAEKCQVADNRLHLYLVCHRSLEEYAQISRLRRGVGDDKQLAEDMRKETGRFTLFHMRSSEEEMFGLIDQVIIQAVDTKSWQRLVKDHQGDFVRLAEAAASFRLFPTLSPEQILGKVAYGAFPLNPITSYSLPRLSERVAQNERTLFTYLSDSGSRTLGDFVASQRVPTAEEPLPLASVADLWDYFEEQIASEERTKRIHQLYQAALARVPAGSAHGKATLKAVAVFEVIQAEQAKPTSELLRHALCITASQAGVFEEDLDALTSGEGRVLVRNQADGSYRFARGGGGEPLEDKVRKLAQERSASVSPIRHLNDVWNELGLPAAIPATGYSDDRHVPRRLVVEAVQSSELKNLNRWTQNLGAGAFVDGYALLVVAEDTTQLEEAAKRAREIDHPQIAIGIPKEPLPKLFGDLRRHEALIYLGQTEANLYGPGADSCEEWTASCDEYHTLLQQAVEPLINGRAGRLDLVSWIWRGDEQEGITSVSRLTAFSSRVMETVFPLTPSIPHDILADEAQKDTFRKHRMPVIDLLLSQDGPAKLAAPGVKPQKHVIDALLRHNGILRSVGGRFEVARPNEEQFPAMAATWDVIAAFIERCKGAPQALDDLVTELRRPPYGLPVRCMPLIFASVARETIGRGNLVIRYQRTRTIEERITRVDGEAIETAFASPVQFRIDHVDVSVKQRVLLQGFAHGMGFAWPDEAEIGQALEELADDAKRWWIGLPGHAHLTKVLDSPALVIKRDIFEPLAHPETDAHKILLETMPDIVRVPDEVGAEIENDELHEMVARVFSDVKEEFEGAVSRATERVQTVVAEAFSAHCPSATAASDALRIWHDGLDQTKKDYKFVGDAGKLMGVAADPGPDTAAKLAESLMGRPVSGWADEVVDQFQGRLQGAKLHVEAFQLPPRDGGGDGSGEGGDGGKLPPGHARIRIVLEGETYEKVIALATQVSDNGRHLENLLRSAVTGMGSQLPDGECLTIVLQIFKDALDGY